MIDLRSDTVTQPTDKMREAMAKAVVGDDVYRDDPTVIELEELAASMLKKEAGLFCASGTMGNQLAIMTHTRRGDEIIAGNQSHIFTHEVGAPALLSGVSVCTPDFVNSIPDARTIEKAIRPVDIHEPPTALICLENALANGRVVTLETMKEIFDMAKSHALPIHLDGARIFNAATYLKVEACEIAQYVDTVSCCLSKGLCAPVGTVLVGPAQFIERARKFRKLLGGGMRQAGILAAAGIIALKDMTKRLDTDHQNALYLAKLLDELEGVSVDHESVQINMVWFKLDRDEKLLNDIPRRMIEKGIKINGSHGGVFRFVTSNDISREDIQKAVEGFKSVIA